MEAGGREEQPSQLSSNRTETKQTSYCPLAQNFGPSAGPDSDDDKEIYDIVTYSVSLSASKLIVDPIVKRSGLLMQHQQYAIV